MFELVDVPSAPADFRAVLEDRRGKGWPFQRAFFDAVFVACRGRKEWESVFADTRETWRRAYENQPATCAEMALLEIVGPEGRFAEIPDRVCEGCGGPLPATADHRQKYHDGTCRVRAHRERRRLSRAVTDASELMGQGPLQPSEALGYHHLAA